MTALELAVYLEDITDSEESPYRQAATMLRQQQAEIERLTMLCDCMTTESNRKGNEIEKLGSELDRIVELYTDKAIENEALKLRDQQAEIEQLKALLISLSDRNANIQYTKASEK